MTYVNCGIRFGLLLLGALPLTAGCAAKLPEAAYDRGGVTFDFEKVSAEKYPPVKVGREKNVIGDAWNGSFSQEVIRIVPLPDARGGTYRLTARTRVWQERTGFTAFQITPGTGANGFAESVGHPALWCPLSPRPDPAYQLVREIVVKPGDDCLRIRLLVSKARVELADVALEMMKESVASNPRDPLEMRTPFCDARDGRFAIGEGQYGELGFVWRLTGETKVSPQDVTFRMVLPKGVAFVGSPFADAKTVVTEDHEDGSSVTSFRGNESVSISGEWRWWKAGYVLVASLGPGVEGEGWLEMTGRDGKGVAFSVCTKPISFYGVPAFRAEVPRRFGVCMTSRDVLAFDDDRATEKFAVMMHEMGVNWLKPSPVRLKKTLPTLRRCGFVRITPQDCDWLRNGYTLGFYPLVPESERFVGATPWPWRDWSWLDHRSFCPLAIAEGTPFFRTNAFPRVAELLKGTDGIGCNWEPQAYEGRGCVCERCKRAFAAYLGKGVDEVSAGWPTNVLRRFNGVWAKEGERFRSLCHARATKTINRLVREVTGSDSIGFMPDVFFGHFASSWRTQRPCPEAQEIDYADEIPWFEIWAPYVAWRPERGPYVKERVRWIACWCAARDVRAQVARDYPEGKRPKFIGAGAGPIDGYLTQPESVEMEALAYFLNRIEAVGPWEFPAGADARFTQAYGRAATVAAKYEDVVWDGEEISDKVVLEPDAAHYAAPVEGVMPRWLPDCKAASLLQTAAFRKDGLVLVAAYNAWQDGEAFFTLRTGLPAGEYEIVSDDGVLWAKTASRPAWSAAEIAAGVRLEAGASRCRLFEIRRSGSVGLTAATSIMTAARLAGHFAVRKEALAAASVKDHEVATYDIFGPSKVD